MNWLSLDKQLHALQIAGLNFMEHLDVFSKGYWQNWILLVLDQNLMTLHSWYPYLHFISDERHDHIGVLD